MHSTYLIRPPWFLMGPDPALPIAFPLSGGGGRQGPVLPGWRVYQRLKGTVSQDFCFRFFYVTSSSKPLNITLGSFRMFFEDSLRFSQVKAPAANFGYRCCCWYRWKICHWCQQYRHWHRRKIAISNCWHLKVNLKGKIYIFVNCTQSMSQKNN